MTEGAIPATPPRPGTPPVALDPPAPMVDTKALLIDPMKEEIASISLSISSQRLLLTKAHSTLAEHSRRCEHLAQDKIKFKRELRDLVEEREQIRAEVRAHEDLKKPISTILGSSQ